MNNNSVGFNVSVKVLKSKALHFLSKREYAYKELFDKLKKYGADTDIKNVLEELMAKGWLSEVRYINNYLDSKIARYGLRKIKYDLLTKTDNQELIEEVFKQRSIDEYLIALHLWEKKFGKILAPTSKDRLKQAKFLYNKGFSWSVIKRVVKEL